MRSRDSPDLIEHFGDLIDDETREILKKYLNEGKFEKIVEGRVEKVYENSEVKVLLLDSGLKVNLLDKAYGLEVFEGFEVKVKGSILDGKINAKDPKDLEVKVNFTPISELSPEKRQNLRGRISGFGDVEFAREIYVSDETGRIKVLLWEEREVYENADIGDFVEIFNSLIKMNARGEIEAHVDKRSKVKNKNRTNKIKIKK